MTHPSSLKDKHILAVYNEWDLIETINEELCESNLDLVRDTETALENIFSNQYDIALIDVMMPDGIHLLEACVKKDVPVIVLIAATAPSRLLMKALEKGAVSYLAKKHTDKLPGLIQEILDAGKTGIPSWKSISNRIKDFDPSLDHDMDPDLGFWSGAKERWRISKGIQKRLLYSKKVIDKGI